VIRKAMIVLLTLGAAVSGVVCVDSYRLRGFVRSSPSGRMTMTDSTGKPVRIPGLYWTHMYPPEPPNRYPSMLRVRTESGLASLEYERPEPLSTATFDRRVELILLCFREGVHVVSSGPPLDVSSRTSRPNEIPLFHAHVRELSVSLDLTTLLLALYPAMALLRGPLRRWQRRRTGSCLHCGYNLIGNESGTCPECGRARQQ